MRKKLLSMVIVFFLCAGLAGVPVEAAYEADSDFIIENGVLVKYTGAGGYVMIPDGVTEIGDSAFTNTGSGWISTVVIPEGCTRIGNEAFYFCGSFTGFTISLPSTLREIGGEAFCESNISSIRFPEGLVSIGDSAFEGCDGLTQVDFPSTLQSIGYGAFNNCSNLTQITFASGADIGTNAFIFTKLSEVSLPVGTVLHQGAFSYTNISSADIGGRAPTDEEQRMYFYETPLYNGQGTFDSADSFLIENGVLVRCTVNRGTVIVPEGVTTIGERAFQDGVAQVILPSTLTAIESRAFDGCSIQEIDIPDSVTSIGSYAFTSCRLLERVTLPAGLARLEEHVFQDCSSLSDITLPGGLQVIGDYAFSGCRSLTGIQFPASLTEIGVCAFRYSGFQGAVAFPDGLKKLGGSAFSSTGITSIVLPEGLEELGIGFAGDCSNLTSVTFPRTGQAVEELKDLDAHLFWDYLASYHLTEVVNIPNTAYANAVAYNQEAIDKLSAPSNYVTPQTEAIIAQSNLICAGLTSDYEKAQAIHEWVAKNIDYVYETRFIPNANTASSVLENRRAVCAGFSTLSRALLRAQGIPAVYIVGRISDGESHAWNLVYADEHWFFMDSTWGRPGGNGLIYDARYFDPSIYFLSSTHSAGLKSITGPNYEDPTSEDATGLLTQTYQISDWAREQAEQAIDARLLPEGFGTDFQVNITRSQFAAVSVKLYEAMSGTVIAPPTENPFRDTEDDYVLRAAAMGFVEGTGSGTFDPDDLVSREQAATMLTRVFTALGGEVPDVTATAFVDNGDISSWALDSVAFMAEREIVQGVEGGRFDPQGQATIEQALLIALRMYQNLI